MPAVGTVPGVGTTGPVAGTAAGVGTASEAGSVPAIGAPGPYAFDEGARQVTGAGSSTDAERLTPGRTYRSALARPGKLYYRLELGAQESVYVSATAVPGLGAKVSFRDGLAVSVEDGNGINCSSERTRFGSSESPRPISTWATRRIGPGTYSCKTAGTYYVVVERESEPTSTRDPWELELRVSSEPRVRTLGPTAAPETWNSASPVPMTGDQRTRAGGTSFNSAPGLEPGVWQDGIRAGQTRYYWVPVDWGQQLSARAELGTAPGDGFVPSALVLTLFNPARGPVDQTQSTYDGKQKVAAFDPLPPVRYENRYHVSDDVKGMRFSGRYYLAVHLSEEVAETFGEEPIGLTLRVRVDGNPSGAAAPAYDGEFVPAEEFGVTAQDKEQARQGETDGAGDGTTGARDPATMRALAVGSFGLGTALVLFLVGWTVLARRRAASGRLSSVRGVDGSGGGRGPGGGSGAGGGGGGSRGGAGDDVAVGAVPRGRRRRSPGR
ncbi:hypothetical protein [Streptomyces uncialis]|uniref:hypothetical protein n=1 Tax=Streptomyces uncialis TaxID=1048205 RepID=UPI00224D2C0D|nr:hypothetical protein [Streptomyces uncialis]MCX4661464.1 hypothetical protein [Streptomyces uncialis]